MRNVIPRGGLVLFVLGPILIAADSFRAHLTYFLSGQIHETLITGNWKIVALNVGIFLAFAGFLFVRRSVDWSSIGGVGIYAAFIVSLFVEMYGVPLTIFLGSGLIAGPTQPPETIFTFQAFGQGFSMNLWMIHGVFVTALGMALVAVGWWQVYRGEGLVTDGLYEYSRNPQYVGIALIALGWVIGFPTILTLVLFPLLVGAYYNAARHEAGDMRERYGDDYEEWASETPLFI
jgi:protein-S-isoprenylcysteine O-methyltransferase Ste14